MLSPVCSIAKLNISSIITIVFPTPTPLNKPILPPFLYGVSRSIAFISVSNSDVSTLSFSIRRDEEYIGFMRADNAEAYFFL